MKYIRFVDNENIGLFQKTDEVLYENIMKEDDSFKLTHLMKWFDSNLQEPTKLVKSKSKGFYRKDTKAICWFYEDAEKFINKSKEMISILEKYNIKFIEIESNNLGYVVYKDKYQIAAIPFKDRI